MATEVHLGLTGAGFQPFSGSGTNLIARVLVQSTGFAGQAWPVGTPGRYVGLGWVSAYELFPANFDGSGNPETNMVVNPVVWIDSLAFDFDMTPLNTDLFGVTGLAYGLNAGVSIDLYVTQF